MLNETVLRTYIYNGHGHALSGHITQPFDHQIEVQAGMSLPTTGGIGRARVENFRFQEYVSFTAGYTHVAGSTSGNAYTTLVTAVVENLNILDVVTADRVVARLASHYSLDEGKGRKPNKEKRHKLDEKLKEDEPHITLLGSKIENLKISGCPVHLEFEDDLFLRLDTFDTLKKEFDGNAGFRKMAADPFVTTPPRVPVDPCGVFLCSLVKDMKINCPGVKPVGHALEVPEFGRVYIGEVIAERCKRTVTMLRIQLGCPISGNTTVVQAMSNGRPYPPS
jgi:hypothetical protein